MLTKNKRKNIFGTLALFIATIIWGGGFVTSDIALQGYTPIQIMMIRFFVASIFMMLICKDRKISKNEIKYGIILGIFVFLGFFLQIVGLEYTTPAKNAFLTGLNVIIVPFLGFVVAKQKIEIGNVVCAMLSIIGVGILSLNKNLTLGIGDTLTILCAVAFAMQIYYTGKFVNETEPEKLNMIQMIVAFLLSLIANIYYKKWSLHITRIDSTFSVIYLGVLSTGVCYVIQTTCQKYVPPTETAVILSMEAVFGTILSVIILHEPTSPRMILGCIIIFVAVIVASIMGEKNA